MPRPGTGPPPAPFKGPATAAPSRVGSYQSPARTAPAPCPRYSTAASSPRRVSSPPPSPHRQSPPQPRPRSFPSNARRVPAAHAAPEGAKAAPQPPTWRRAARHGQRGRRLSGGGARRGGRRSGSGHVGVTLAGTWGRGPPPTHNALPGGWRRGRQGALQRRQPATEKS